MDRKHSILTVVKNKKTFQSSYFCLSKGSIYECSGDDDGGIFTIDTSSKNLELKIQHLNVGEPDHEIFEIPENNKLKLTGKACK